MSQIPEHFEDVGVGWRPILETLHNRLVAIDPGYNVAQIKEKFGGLRAYIDFSAFEDGQERILEASKGPFKYRVELHPSYIRIGQRACSEAELLSFHTCELCGEPGETRFKQTNSEYAWQRTLCDICALAQDYYVEGTYFTGTGQLLGGVHSPESCEGQHCVIHDPSDHIMVDFKTHWRQDRGIMERICPHGVGHPDPDDLAYRESVVREGASVKNSDDISGTLLENEISALGIHGCDGCCKGAYA